jgi:hypothetical protein
MKIFNKKEIGLVIISIWVGALFSAILSSPLSIQEFILTNITKLIIGTIFFSIIISATLMLIEFKIQKK